MKQRITATALPWAVLMLAPLFVTGGRGQPYGVNCLDRFSPLALTTLNGVLDRTAGRNGLEQVRLRFFARIDPNSRCVREDRVVQTKYALVDLGSDGARNLVTERGDSLVSHRVVQFNSRHSGRVGSQSHRVYATNLRANNLRRVA